ncbi:hypothetical protein E4T42_00274 [Aureobasidium subglaciale]|nr:hypothetical protein E4T42_00274 [Aureobasidium subglaciale]
MIRRCRTAAYNLAQEYTRAPETQNKKQAEAMQSRTFSLLFLGLIALFALVLPAAADPDWGVMWNNRRACGGKDGGRVLGAISKFCYRNMFAGEIYASDGQATNGVRVGIGASCGWDRFIPQVWCEYQMLEVCAQGGKKGRGKKRYDGGCQHFWITNG